LLNNGKKTEKIMALWGHTSGTESKPNWLSDAEKTNTSAKPHGWELKKIVGSKH